jgi:hypothetical protein
MFQGHQKVVFLVFVVYIFVVLEVIARGSWSVGFSDEAQSRLQHENFS